MFFMPYKGVVTGMIIGIVLMQLSRDYVIISRRRFDRLRAKTNGN